MTTRADVELVARGLVKSRTLARRLIEAGAVFTEGPGGEVPVTRAAQPVFPDQPLRVVASGASRFVSRGGNKLDAALDAAGIDCTGLDALDVGMSTGGFTHCLLERGARQVLGIEVGHGQLDPQLAADPRVKCLEHTHIRDVQLANLVLPDGSRPLWPPASRHGIPQQDTVPDPAWQPAGPPPGNTPFLPDSTSAPTVPRPGFPLIVVDLSFIAASQQLARLASLAAPGGRLVCLIKPQFELGPQARNRQGIVRRTADLDGLRRDVIQRATDAGWQVDGWQTCAIMGGDGNQEYFLVATRQPVPPSLLPSS